MEQIEQYWTSWHSGTVSLRPCLRHHTTPEGHYPPFPIPVYQRLLLHDSRARGTALAESPTNFSSSFDSQQRPFDWKLLTARKIIGLKGHICDWLSGVIRHCHVCTDPSPCATVPRKPHIVRVRINRQEAQRMCGQLCRIQSTCGSGRSWFLCLIWSWVLAKIRRLQDFLSLCSSSYWYVPVFFPLSIF